MNGRFNFYILLYSSENDTQTHTQRARTHIHSHKQARASTYTVIERKYFPHSKN